MDGADIYSVGWKDSIVASSFSLVVVVIKWELENQRYTEAIVGVHPTCEHLVWNDRKTTTLRWCQVKLYIFYILVL